MNRTVILAAGGFPSKDGEPWRVLVSASRVVACDSAADAFYGAFRRWPDVVVGDMDSVSSSPDAEVVRDAGQDDNDLAKALRLCRERIAHKDIIVYGEFIPLLENDANVYAYRRALDGRELTVLCNWTDKTVPCALARAETGEELISNYPEHKEGFLYPYEARVLLK